MIHVKKVIYIAGPYRHPDEYRVWENIMSAREAAMEIWKLGAVPLCPHLNTMLMGGLVNFETILAGDLELVSRCDAVMSLPNWPSSAGACEEVSYARKLDLPVFGGPNAWQELTEWLK